MNRVSPEALGLRRREERIAAIGSVTLHLSVGLLFILLGKRSPEPEEPPPPPIQIDWVALTALGEAPKPNEMTRIVQPPPPPPPAADAVSLSRQTRPAPPPPPPPAPAPPPRQRRERRRPRRERTRRRPPERRAARSLADLFRDDPRADNAPQRGHREGHVGGRSDTMNASSAAMLYASRIGRLIERRFRVPATISERERRRLSVTLHLRLRRRGSTAKVRGAPRWVERSGNRFFDAAALRAVEVFGPEGEGKLPLPPSSERALREQVLRDGLQVILDGER